MAQQALITITVPAASTTPIVVAGLGHKPEVIFAFSAGQSATADSFGRGNATEMFGVAINANTQYASRRSLVDGQPASANTQALVSGALVATSAGSARIAAITSGGFVLAITAAFTTSRVIHVLTLGSGLITNKALFSFLTPTVTGSVNLTQPGFQPTGAIFFSNGSEGASDNSSHASISLGWAAGPSGSIVNFGSASHSRGNGASADGSRWAKNGYCYGEISKSPNGNTVVERAGVTAWLPTGVEVTFDTVTAQGNNVVAVLALDGPGIRAGALTLGEECIAGLPWVPRASLFASHCNVEQTDLEATPDDSHSIGGAALGDTSLTQNCIGVFSEDGAVSSEIGRVVQFDAVFARMISATAKQGELALENPNANGYPLSLAEPAPTNDLVGYISFGEAPPSITRDRTATVPVDTESPNSPIATFTKDPDSLLDYEIDWSNFLSDPDGNVVDSLIASSFIPGAGITVRLDPPATFTSTKTRVWIEGGTEGSQYDIVNRIRTSDGRIEDRFFRIKIKSR